MSISRGPVVLSVRSSLTSTFARRSLEISSRPARIFGYSRWSFSGTVMDQYTKLKFKSKTDLLDP